MERCNTRSRLQRVKRRKAFERKWLVVMPILTLESLLTLILVRRNFARCSQVLVLTEFNVNRPSAQGRRTKRCINCTNQTHHNRITEQPNTQHLHCIILRLSLILPFGSLKVSFFVERLGSFERAGFLTSVTLNSSLSLNFGTNTRVKFTALGSFISSQSFSKTLTFLALQQGRKRPLTVLNALSLILSVFVQLYCNGSFMLSFHSLTLNVRRFGSFLNVLIDVVVVVDVNVRLLLWLLYVSLRFLLVTREFNGVTPGTYTSALW